MDDIELGAPGDPCTTEAFENILKITYGQRDIRHEQMDLFGMIITADFLMCHEIRDSCVDNVLMRINADNVASIFSFATNNHYGNNVSNRVKQACLAYLYRNGASMELGQWFPISNETAVEIILHESFCPTQQLTEEFQAHLSLRFTGFDFSWELPPGVYSEEHRLFFLWKLHRFRESCVLRTGYRGLEMDDYEDLTHFDQRFYMLRFLLGAHLTPRRPYIPEKFLDGTKGPDPSSSESSQPPVVTSRKRRHNRENAGSRNSQSPYTYELARVGSVTFDHSMTKKSFTFWPSRMGEPVQYDIIQKFRSRIPPLRFTAVFDLADHVGDMMYTTWERVSGPIPYRGSFWRFHVKSSGLEDDFLQCAISRDLKEHSLRKNEWDRVTIYFKVEGPAYYINKDIDASEVDDCQTDQEEKVTEAAQYMTFSEPSISIDRGFLVGLSLPLKSPSQITFDQKNLTGLVPVPRKIPPLDGSEQNLDDDAKYMKCLQQSWFEREMSRKSLKFTVTLGYHEPEKKKKKSR